MRAEEKAQYRESIASEIRDWEPEASRDDPWWPLIKRTPDWFDGLASLASDASLSDKDRRLTRRVMKYLISPLDLRPEFIYGPEGFREDLGLIAQFVAQFRDERGDEILERNGLEPTNDYWIQVKCRYDADLDDDLRLHLALLLKDDSVAGDEDLAWAETADDLIAPPPKVGQRGHKIVFAGPGTGKTHRIEEELKRLLIDEKVPPDQILVTTFTNKAADELRIRVHTRLVQHNAAEADRIMQQLGISTIHGFALQLISRYHHHALFLKGTFSPMSPTQRMLFLFRNSRDLGIFDLRQDWVAERQAAGVRGPIDLFTFYSHVGEIYDFLSEDVLSASDRRLRHRYLQILRGGDQTANERIISTYPKYWQLVQERGFLDYSMLLAYTEALLQDPQVRRKVCQQIQYVLVDEYQDTNPIQDRIFRSIIGEDGRMFAVGDDDQSIYAFRGADVRNATEFVQRWPSATEDKLEENRRSTKSILRAASELISNNSVRVPKDLTTKNAGGVRPWNLAGTEKELPDQLATLLNRMKAQGLIKEWREVAILFRGLSTDVPKYVETLRKAGIDAQIHGNKRFLKKPVVRAFRAILEFIGEDALNVGPRTRKHKPFFEELGIESRDDMLSAMEKWHQALHAEEYDSILDLFYSILRDSGAIGHELMLADLGHLSSFIADAEEQLKSPNTVKRLTWFNKYAEAAAGAFDGPAADPDDAVQVMTIHKAKGLEFPVVVIADVSADSIPANFGSNIRDKLRYDMAQIEPTINPMEEERRVLYVGMTRARNYLILTSSNSTPSPFLAEFGHDPVPTADPLPRTAAVAYGPPRHSQPPLHAHHGAIYNFKFCPRRYLLENRYTFAGRVIAPLRAGQSLHRALEIYHRLLLDGEHVTKDRRERIMERAWVRPSGKRDAKKEWETLFGVFNNYADGWEVEAEKNKLRTVAIERPFYVAQGGGVLTGRIDLVRERNDHMEIVEFKYNKNDMMPEYPQLQLSHYSLAYPNEQPGLVVHYLKEDKEEVIKNRPAEPIREELENIFERIRKKEFDAKPSVKSCRLCPMRFACSSSLTRVAA